MSILESGIAQVHKDLEALPEDTKGAMVATVNSKGVYTFAVARKLDHGWDISAGVQGRLNKTIPDAYVGVTKVWK